MAVLDSRMEDPQPKKKTLKSSKATILLAQDLIYARNLSANEEKVRRKSLKYLKKYLEQKSKAQSLTEESLKVLWKGLFYSMWMSDKPLVQEECAENISHLIHCLKFDESMHFFKIGILTLQNEWFGIDQLRLDKFSMLVRRLLRQALCVVKKRSFKKQPNETFTKVLEETILSTTKSVPLGLWMHFTEIYLEELAKVSDGKLNPSRTVDLLKPFIYKLAFADDDRIIQWINKFIFTYLMKQHKLGLEYDEKYKIWKEHGFVGSINQIQKVAISDTESEGSDSDDEKHISTGPKPLDPRAGRVDVELPQILFNAKEISETLLLHKSDSRTSKNSRRDLTVWSERFLKLHNGVYPLGIGKLKSKVRTNLDIDTNVTRAAKRLIKFEQKLLANQSKANKRKREDSDVRVEESEISNPKKKKKKTLRIESENIVPLEKDKVKKLKLKASELKNPANKIAPKKREKTMKAKVSAEALNSSIGDCNFCFERNSGVWYVTAETSEKKDVPKQNPELNSDAKETRNEEYEIFIPSKKFVKKLKKTKSNDEVEQTLSRLRGKSRTNLNKLSLRKTVDDATPINLHMKQGSPKKVVINTRFNISQDINDYILRIKSSPHIPWDSNKKPGKPLLKTPVKASPVNPFYKLRRF